MALIAYVLWSLVKLAASFPDITSGVDVRWHVLALIGLLTALGGLVGARLALIRVFTTERQTTATKEGLVTDRIAKAVAGLGGERS